MKFVNSSEAILLRTMPRPFQEITGNVHDEHVNITHIGNNLTAIIKNLNFRIEASWHMDRKNHRYINYRVFVPRDLCNKSFGHLGNCDGTPDITPLRDECECLNRVYTSLLTTIS